MLENLEANKIWLNTSLELNLSLTFTCTVKVFIEESELPADCPESRRRRREVPGSENQAEGKFDEWF